MKKTRRQYTREFKLEALRLLETSGKSATQIERDLGIGKGNLCRWKRKLLKDGQDAFPGHGRLTPEQERIRQLERENEVLRQQRDILKMESFFGTLKSELVHHCVYHTRTEARTDLFFYIETFYNRRRRHSALDYLSPEAYDQLYHQRDDHRSAARPQD